MYTYSVNSTETGKFQTFQMTENLFLFNKSRVDSYLSQLMLNRQKIYTNISNKIKIALIYLIFN